ncbi:hypothetical protein CRYUN_Cryun08bG0070800 [Craigia yunnanensis]
MASFPHPGSVTICEINRDLVTADALSDDRAKETYGKLLGIVFSSVPFRSIEDPAEPPPTSNAAVSQPKRFGMITRSLKHIFQPNDIDLLPEVALQGVSWHQHKHILAFISGSNQVTIRDYEDSGKEPCILTSESQRDVKVLEWRPNGGKSLSVACKQSCEQKNGQDGIGTPIRRGLGGTSVIKWSPTGDYFFSGKFDGTFYLWETSTWTSEPWSSASGFVTGATWDPDGHMVLLAFSRSSTLGSIHFASKPPSLDAHLLPVDLPEIISLTGSQGIEKIAWDASGERLAVSYKGGDDTCKGLIAIYDTRRNPLIYASLIGFIRGPGDNPKPIAFSFHDKFKQGSLLSVRCGNLNLYNCAGAVGYAVPTLSYFIPKFFGGQGF